MPHIEHTVHLFRVCPAFFLYHFEQRGNWEKIVFYHSQSLAEEMQYLCLCSTGAVNHSVDVVPHFLQDGRHYRCVSAGRRKHELSGIERGTLNRVGEIARAGEFKFIRNSRIAAFRIFLKNLF